MSVVRSEVVRTVSPLRPAPNHHCPLCGGPNACAPASCGSFDTPCWCQHASFPAALLACVTGPDGAASCICAACAAAEARRVSADAVTASHEARQEQAQRDRHPSNKPVMQA